jgi:hypothetical protein
VRIHIRIEETHAQELEEKDRNRARRLRSERRKRQAVKKGESK